MNNIIRIPLSIFLVILIVSAIASAITGISFYDEKDTRFPLMEEEVKACMNKVNQPSYTDSVYKARQKEHSSRKDSTNQMEK
jgi:hypothetical protein